MSTELIQVEKKAELVNKTSYRQHSDNTRPVSFLTEGEVNAMAETARQMRNGERNELLILATFQCALRISETLQITKQHRRVIDGKHRLFILGKGNKPRILSLPEALSYRLGDYIGRSGLGDTDRLFPISRQRHGALSSNVLSKQVSIAGCTAIY